MTYDNIIITKYLKLKFYVKTVHLEMVKLNFKFERKCLKIQVVLAIFLFFILTKNKKNITPIIKDNVINIDT